MKINKREFNKWIEALRSGKHKQTRGRLQDQNGFCCLGVACDVLIKEKDKIKYIPEANSVNYLSGFLPQDQHKSPQWLDRINGDFINKTGRSLSSLNDSGEYSFDEITDLLEAVYIHGVLN